MPGILAIFETRNNLPLPVCAELTTVARLLSASGGAETDALCPVGRCRRSQYLFSAKVFDRLLFAEHDQFIYGNPQLAAQLAYAVARDWDFDYILLPHTIDGSATAAAIAAKLKAACIPSVTGLEFDGASVSFIGSLLGGKLNIEISPAHKPVVLTIAPGAFEAAVATDIDLPPIEILEEKYFPQQLETTTLGLTENERTDRTLEQAEVIVSAGRGIGKRENIALIEQLAELFDKSAVGGSRPVCDYGWLPYSRQVGITGRSVRPKLYLACGISGSSQHLAGIREAEYIVAINRDPSAAIFSVADIAVVDDLHHFIPAFIEEFKKRS